MRLESVQAIAQKLGWEVRPTRAPAPPPPSEEEAARRRRALGGTKARPRGWEIGAPPTPLRLPRLGSG